MYKFVSICFLSSSIGVVPVWYLCGILSFSTSLDGGALAGDNCVMFGEVSGVVCGVVFHAAVFGVVSGVVRGVV